MKQGSSTVIGLLTFLLLATFGAAAYFVSRAYSAQQGQSAAIQEVEQHKKKAADLGQVAGRLEAGWQSAATEADNAVAQLDQFRSLVVDQDKEIEYLLNNLQTLSNQLNTASASEQNLNQRMIQLDKEKRGATEASSALRDQLSALEKEFDTLKIANPGAIPPAVPPPTVAGLTPAEIRGRLNELAQLKASGSNSGAATPTVSKPSVLTGISGTVREVNAEFDFVILDLGAPNGVKAGDEFAVTRAKEPVGRLRVRRLHSGLCICDIIVDQTRRAIMRGDRVEQLK
jgi:hypothetical protein